MTSVESRRLFVWLVAALALVGLTVASCISGNPGPWSPCPVFVILLVYVTHGLGYAIVGPLLLLIATWRLIRGDARIGVGASTICAMVVVLDVLFLSGCLPFALRYGRVEFVVVVSLANALAIALLGILWFRAQRAPSFGRTFAFYWVFTAWLCTYAFAWLGETP